MKRRSLLLATLLSLVLTSIVLARTGWSFSRTGRPVPPRRTEPDTIRVHESISAEAALRYRQCQPTHWRTCLLQR
jgi:hypothetical protein